ncbi:unnamed protein product [Protopolystoma xenopodis]|uniref:Uncharacterized protein n=1 Tax=Protopolystoma xenopodis TaxID=117903 RepID=A0A3S5ATJ0_9PLAT|nr:unnamed protein product [Protopolystoma xenopodis]
MSRPESNMGTVRLHRPASRPTFSLPFTPLVPNDIATNGLREGSESYSGSAIDWDAHVVNFVSQCLHPGLVRRTSSAAGHANSLISIGSPTYTGIQHHPVRNKTIVNIFSLF